MAERSLIGMCTTRPHTHLKNSPRRVVNRVGVTMQEPLQPSQQHGDVK